MRWKRKQGICCLGSERRTLVPASIPRGGGEKAILSPLSSYRTPMDLEPQRGRRQVAEPCKTLPLLIGSWASVAETAKWERALCSWNVCIPDPSCRSGDPDVLGPQCSGPAESRPAGFRGGSAPADTAVRPGSSGPQPGPCERQGPEQLPMAPWSPGCPPGPVLPPRAGLGTQSQSPGDAAGSRPKRPAPGCGGGGREDPRPARCCG